MSSRDAVVLDPATRRRAAERAGRLGLGLSDYVERLIRDDLVDGDDRIDVAAVFDLGDSGGADVARHKDAMLAAAVEAEASRLR